MDTPLRVLCIVSFSVFSACAKPLPEIKLANLANRSTVNLSVKIEDDRRVENAAYTRGEGTVSGIGAGAAGALEGGFSTGDPFGIVLGVVLVPVFATVGGVYGASTGTSKSRQEILRAAQTINQSYQPAKFERAFEAAVAKSLRDRLFDSSAPCFSTRSSRGKCPQGAMASNLKIRTTFNLEPANSGAGSGNMDFIGLVAMISEPEGVLQPPCIRFEYRNPAGNLFELAENNGQPLKSAFQATLNDFATELPKTLRSEEANWGASSWKRRVC